MPRGSVVLTNVSGGVKTRTAAAEAISEAAVPTEAAAKIVMMPTVCMLEYEFKIARGDIRWAQVSSRWGCN